MGWKRAESEADRGAGRAGRQEGRQGGWGSQRDKVKSRLQEVA